MEDSKALHWPVKYEVDLEIYGSIGGSTTLRFAAKKKGNRNHPIPLLFSGRRNRIRTCDPCLVRAMLYQLSYPPARISPREKTT